MILLKFFMQIKFNLLLVNEELIKSIVGFTLELLSIM